MLLSVLPVAALLVVVWVFGLVTAVAVAVVAVAVVAVAVVAAAVAAAVAVVAVAVVDFAVARQHQHLASRSPDETLRTASAMKYQETCLAYLLAVQAFRVAVMRPAVGS